MAFILIASFLLMTGCGPGAVYLEQNGTGVAPANETRKDIRAPNEESFSAADGVVAFDGTADELEKAEWKIVIFAADGRPLKTIDQRDDSIVSLEGESGDFYPLDFSNGNKRDFEIEMRLTGRSESWLEVVAHESRTPKTKGYVRIGDPLFKTLSWKEWVLGHFNLRFDPESNPLLEDPDGSRASASLPAEPLIRPEEVRGDWVRLRWKELEPEERSVEWLRENVPKNTGWIRWRENGKILISEYYP